MCRTSPEPVLSVPPDSSFRRVIVTLLLGLGVLCWLSFGYPADRRSLEVAAVILLVLLIPPIRRGTAIVLDGIRHPSPRSANWTAVGVTIGSALLLYAFAAGQGRPFVPTFHDEHTHLIQMQMLARGRLWMPQHPLADFFDTFLVLVKPVYAAIYFPGTSLLYIPTVWLHLPYWSMPLLVAGAVVGMTYRVMIELTDGVAGLLGGLVLLSLQPFRLVSIMMLSHPLMMLWSLIGIWAWLRWRRKQERGWALVLGIVFGWAAITRPLDALCYAVPLGAGVLWDLRRKAIVHRVTTLGLIAAGVIPFLTFQLIENYGITGHPLETPYHAYWTRNYGGDALGFAPFNPEWKSTLLQQRAYHEYYNLPVLKSHTADTILPNLYNFRLPTFFQANLPNPILLILMPVGILGLVDSRRRLVWSTLPIFIGAYSLFPFFQTYYGLPAALPLTLMLILGIRAVAESWPGQQRAIGTILTLVVASFAITAMPGVKTDAYDPGRAWPVMTAVHTLLPKAVRAPAVVLFPFHWGDDYHEEPVYNVDVAWPDDAPIIHVQDLGPERNQALASYYARTQPDRTFYRFDRRDSSIVQLGNPEEFLASLRRGLAAETTSHPPAGQAISR